MEKIHVGGWLAEIAMPVESGQSIDWINLGAIDPSSSSSATGGEAVRITPQNAPSVVIGTNAAQQNYNLVWLEPDLEKLGLMGLGTHTPATSTTPEILDVGPMDIKYIFLRITNKKANGVARSRVYLRAYLQNGQVIESPGSDEDQTAQTTSLPIVCEQWVDETDNTTKFYKLYEGPIAQVVAASGVAP